MVEKRKIDTEAIFLKLREEILSGAHPSGTPFRELSLAERFQISRTPVRAVLSRLEQERLLVRVDRGLEVPAADPERVIQVYDMRIHLEGMAASEAARSHQLSDLLQMEAYIARDRELKEPDDQQMIVTNLEFHEAIWRATRNPVLIDLLERLSTHLIHSPRSTLSVENRWDESLNEHEKIIRAIESRDSEKAKALAEEHMMRAKQMRLKLLREDAIRSL